MVNDTLNNGRDIMDRMRYWHSKEDYDGWKRDYVISTTEEYNDLYRRIKEDCGWFTEFIYLVKHYYEEEPTGGSLHIVLDDGNLEDENIAWCAGLAYGVNDHEAMDIANFMRAMTVNQRERVYKHYDYYC